MWRKSARHPTLVAAIASVAFAVALNRYFDAARLIAELARSGAFLGLFATLAGFLITGLTILLTLSDHAALKIVSGTRAFAYIHRSFVAAIWAQIVALVVSVVVQAAPRSDPVHSFVECALLITVFLAGGMLVTSVWYLSLIVNRVLKAKREV